MNKKVNVTINVGTYSYVMGGADLAKLEEMLPAAIKDQVEIRGAVELPGCSGLKPPFVQVNNTLIAEANYDKIIAQIKKELA